MAKNKQRLRMEVGPRSEFGTNANRRLRASGRVPGNVYGMNLDAFAVAVDPREVETVLRSDSGHNTIFTLGMSGSDQSRDVMLREIQRDPVTERLLHVDFVRVDPNKKLQVQVPVELIGTPEGVKNDGGILDHVHREVEVSCLPSAIPEHLDVDVSALHIGQNVTVADLSVPEGVEILDDPDEVLAVVSAPRVEEVDETADEEAAAEGAEDADGEKKDGEDAKDDSGSDD